MTIQVNTKQRLHASSGRLKHYVEVQIDGVGFETECDSQEKALDLSVKTARALGIAYSVVK